jgi:hypothetical protein
MSSEEARDAFERIEEDAERDLARVVAVGAVIVTLGWLAAIAAWLPDLINKL